ncbi:MAG TPA: YbaK/EbsC family protein [Gemmatimonadaceae bacterium]
MAVQNLKELLDRSGVAYESLRHPPAYTAQEVAGSAHVSGKEMIKTLVVKIDGRMALVALPASEHLDLHQLKEATGARAVELATEAEFASLFPGCDVGAMPPFGDLYGMDTYITESLTRDRQIAFNAGTHTEVVRMSYQDFERLAQPKMIVAAARAS